MDARSYNTVMYNTAQMVGAPHNYYHVVYKQVVEMTCFTIHMDIAKRGLQLPQPVYLYIYASSYEEWRT